MKRLSVVIVMMIVLFGCSNTYNETVTEAEEALEHGDFKTARTLYNQALEEVKDSGLVLERLSLLNDYETLQEKIADAEWNEAEAFGADMLEKEYMVASVKKEVEAALAEVEVAKEQEEDLAHDVEELKRLIDNEEVEAADEKLHELESPTNSEAINDELEMLAARLEVVQQRKEKEEQEAQKKVEEEKKLAEKERAEAEAKAKAQEQASSPSSSNNRTVQKVQELERRIAAEGRQSNSSGTTGFYGQYYDEWDKLLNEVWGILKTSMSTAQFNNLKADQQNWIKRKEANFAAMPDQVASERAAGMDYLAEVTAERTYYLIDNYMH